MVMGGADAQPWSLNGTSSSGTAQGLWAGGGGDGRLITSVVRSRASGRGFRRRRGAALRHGALFHDPAAVQETT